MKPASPAQLEFIKSLAAQRTQAILANPAIAAMPTDTSSDASALITILKALPVDPDPSMPEVVAKAPGRKGVNLYARLCSSCGQTVAEKDGFYYTLPTGKYGNHHKAGECPAAPAPAPATAPAVQVNITAGFWTCESGGTTKYVKVYVGQAGYLLGKVLDDQGNWQYQSGVVSALCHHPTTAPIEPQAVLEVVCLRKYGAPLGSEELRIKAAEYGAAHSECIFCARPLNDERSDPSLGGVGYGPDCANKYGLPWGNVNLKKKG